MTKRRALAVLASSLAACRPATSSATPSASGGFEDLSITISAHQGVDSDVSVLVQLAHPARLGKQSCFVAPADMTITVDGQLLQFEDRGGPAPSMRLSGVEISDLIGCRPAMARSPAGMKFSARATSVVAVQQHARRGEVVVSNLLAKRTVSILPSSTVRPGDLVTLAWADNDRWIGSDLATWVALYSPDEFSLTIPRDQLAIRPPQFSFVVPPIRPGRVLVTLYPGYLRQAARARCTGFHRCDVSPNDHHDQLELTIRG